MNPTPEEILITMEIERMKSFVVSSPIPKDD